LQRNEESKTSCQKKLKNEMRIAKEPTIHEPTVNQKTQFNHCTRTQMSLYRLMRHFRWFISSGRSFTNCRLIGSQRLRRVLESAETPQLLFTIRLWSCLHDLQTLRRNLSWHIWDKQRWRCLENGSGSMRNEPCFETVLMVFQQAGKSVFMFWTILHTHKTHLQRFPEIHSRQADQFFKGGRFSHMTTSHAITL
jgi:hypothetical protein